MTFEPFENYLDKAIDIAINWKITMYNAFYLAQAKKFGRLLTSDERQCKVARNIGIDVIFVK